MNRMLKLAKAANLLNEVINDLDTSFFNCDSCTAKRYNNIDETKWSQSLRSALTKINRVAGDLRERGQNKVA